MKNYKNEEIFCKGCPGCSYANHEFELPSGMTYEDDLFTLSQDWELPIPGFLILSPKRHTEFLSELTDEERNKMFEIVNNVVIILRENNISDRFGYIFEEKENRHLHVWIMPRYKWMSDINKDIIDDIGKILDYAKTNFRNEETYDRIKEVSDIVKEKLRKLGENYES